MTPVFIHGAGFTGEVFEGQLRCFAHAHAPDLPGRGAAEGPQSIAVFADFIDRYIVSHALEDVVLCGHSMGGAVAIQAALFGTPVQAIVVLASGARLRVSPALLRMLEEEFEAGVGEIAQLLFAHPTQEQLAYAAASMRRSGLQTIRDYRACDAFDVRGRLAEVDVPLLAVTGELDRMTPVKFAQTMAESVPRGHVEIVPDAGHMVMLERPAEVNATLQAFFEQGHKTAD